MSQRLIDIDKAEGVLRDMLVSAGASLAATDPREIWSVFKDFCRTVEVRTPEDMVLFEIGVFHFFGPEEFHLHFVRQFAHPEEDRRTNPFSSTANFATSPSTSCVGSASGAGGRSKIPR